MLPVLTLALVNVAVWSRFERAAMIEVLRSEYVHAARARGLSERRVLVAHALRNALAPLVTLVALDLGALFSGRRHHRDGLLVAGHGRACCATRR